MEQKTEVRLFQALLRVGDPDWYFVDWWAKGVWIGSPEMRLPRTPSLYEKKTKWPKLAECSYTATGRSNTHQCASMKNRCSGNFRRKLMRT